VPPRYQIIRRGNLLTVVERVCGTCVVYCQVPVYLRYCREECEHSNVGFGCDEADSVLCNTIGVLVSRCSGLSVITEVRENFKESVYTRQTRSSDEGLCGHIDQCYFTPHKILPFWVRIKKYVIRVHSYGAERSLVKTGYTRRLVRSVRRSADLQPVCAL
jgi:hypothetical protein